jgi:hypothetical protein
LPTPDSRVENGHDDRRHGMLDDRDRQALPISIVSRPYRTDRSSKGTFAWISRNRQLTRDFERDAKTVSALMRLAMIRLMLKRLTTPSLCPSPLSHGDVPVRLPLQPGRT